jgi:hypothetical protein
VLTSGIPVIAHHILPLANLIRSIGNLTPRSDEIQPFALQFK